MKKLFAIYFQHDPEAAKAIQLKLKGQGDNGRLFDAAFSKEAEINIAGILFTDEVDPWHRKRIEALYADEPVTIDTTQPPDPEKIEVPDNWHRMPWTALQALASKIAPDETIRTKEDAKRIIADYVDDNAE